MYRYPKVGPYNVKYANFILIVLLAALLLVVPQLVLADEERAAISLGRMNFDYEETDVDGSFLDGEYGNIPGFTVDYSRKLKSKAFARFSLEYYRGEVDYDGHLQDLSDPNVHMFPFKTQTEERIFTLSAYLSSQINKSNNPLSIYGSFSYKNWERNIQGRYVSEDGNLGIPINQTVSDLFEEYSWWQLSAGLHYQLMMASASRLEFYTGILQTLNATMEIGPYELDLEDKQGYEAGVTWFFSIAPNKRLGIGSSITYWEFGRSNPVQISPDEVILEPDSESKMITFKLTYEWDIKKR